MTGIQALWLPIVLSAVFAFIVSSLIHMTTHWHDSDYAKLPNEDAIMGALRPFAIPPGDYVMPRPNDMQHMRSEEFKEKMNKGPKIMMTVLTPGMAGMGKQLAGWFVFLLVIFFFAAYVAGRALPSTATYLQVFRFVGVTAFLGFSGAVWPLRIWYQRSLTTTIKTTLDGLLYALRAAGTFGWLWPR
jgi:hypothetical protein